MAEESSSVSMGDISSGGGLVGGIIDAIVGPIMGVVNAKKAWKRQKKILKNRIRWAVGDMKRAGINPILAVGGGIGGGGASAPMAQTPSTDIGGSFGRFSQYQLQKAVTASEVAFNAAAASKAAQDEKTSAASEKLLGYQAATETERQFEARQHSALYKQQEAESKAREQDIRYGFAEREVEQDLYRSGVGPMLKFSEKAGPSAKMVGDLVNPFSKFRGR